MSETNMKDTTCREIVTKERLYNRLNEEIKRVEILIIKEEVRLETLRATKRNLDEYFEDLARFEPQAERSDKKCQEKKQ